MPANYQNGKIYKILNSENSIVYIGSTTKRYLCDRMGGHRYNAKHATYGYLYAAMREIGIDKFHIELIKLYPCGSLDELMSEEGKYMKKYLKKGIQLYNSTIDGKYSEASKAKIGKAHSGKVLSEATKVKMSGSNNHKFKRGSINFNKSNSSWRFQWKENGKLKSKSFSTLKYGESGAKALAIAFQDSIYPR